MITQNRGTIAFAVCGSFCTLEAALQSARALTAQGWQLLPVMSFAAASPAVSGSRYAANFCASSISNPSPSSAKSGISSRTPTASTPRSRMR